MEFLRTCVSDSEDDTMLKTTRILLKTKTTTDTMMPVMVANVNFRKLLWSISQKIEVMPLIRR